MKNQERAGRDQPAPEWCGDRIGSARSREHEVPEQCQVECRAPAHRVRKNCRAQTDNLEIAEECVRVWATRENDGGAMGTTERHDRAAIGDVMASAGGHGTER